MTGLRCSNKAGYSPIDYVAFISNDVDTNPIVLSALLFQIKRQITRFGNILCAARVFALNVF